MRSVYNEMIDSAGIDTVSMVVMMMFVYVVVLTVPVLLKVISYQISGCVSNHSFVSSEMVLRWVRTFNLLVLAVIGFALSL